MGPLEPNVPQLIIGLVCFFLIFGILGKLVLPRIEKTLAERHDATEGGVERAETARAEAQRVYEEFQSELAAARHEAAQIRQTATEEGAALIAQLRAEGQELRNRMVSEAQVQLAADRVVAEAELREDVIRLAGDLAGRIVGEPLADLPRTRAIADDFFVELDTKTTTRS
ncbi:F0F1 ATP synthase subunit B [Kitasatospora sp. NPDC101155]|uniref:F0F1 ATP synthase subunit B n=1 Tax=Kitasatospora sp. NPDC101155 TaxID=3364097 RepID=UPI003804CB63